MEGFAATTAWHSATDMIVRVLTATLKADQAGQFNELMRTQLPLLRDYPGLRYAKLARRIRGGQQEVCLFEEWKDTASLYGWAGPDLERPRLLPGAEETSSSTCGWRTTKRSTSIPKRRTTDRR